MGLDRVSGVYVIWMLDDYCEEHRKEVYRTIYVGKAGLSVQSRLFRHQAKKGLVGDALNPHVTVRETSNRVAKYVEQVLLDLFDFDGNTTENCGTRPLLVALPLSEWD